MDYVLNPEDFNFHPSVMYPELGDFFGPNTFIKTIAGNKEHGHYWFISIKKRGGILSDDRYEMYAGAFTRGKVIASKWDWPRQVYCGLISNQTFAQDLLKHLMGTLRSDSVNTDGKERLLAKCLYMEDK